MKKLMIVLFSGIVLASCSSAVDKEAAAELCEHLKVEEASTNVLELMEATEEKNQKLKEWQSKYNGKISEDFEEELKTSCPEGHKSATEMGMFAKASE